MQLNKIYLYIDKNFRYAYCEVWFIRYVEN